MANNAPPAALRIKPPPEAPPDETPPETPPEDGAGTITLTGPDLDAFKAAVGHDCKVGDNYTVELTATDVSPDSITFSLDDVEAEYGEGEGDNEPPESEKASGGGAGSARTPAMTYA